MERSRTKLVKWLVILGVISVAAGYLFFRFFSPGDKIAYLTEAAKRRTIQKVVNATGEVGAVAIVDVGAQVSGKVEQLYVTIGQQVKEGDLIAQIDSTTQQDEVNTKKAKLESYQAQLGAARVSLKVAAKRFERLKKLLETQLISREEFEVATENYELTKAKVSELEAIVKEIRIALNIAETGLGYTRITAPITGTVVSVPIKQGQTVNAAISTPTIVQIADLRQMEILMEISEGDIIHLKPGIKVTYSVLADSDKQYETTLKSIDPGLTLLTNNIYTGVTEASKAIYYYGRLVVPNENGQLRIGMTTQNILYVDEAKEVLAVPIAAIKNNEETKHVEVLTAKGVETRLVTTGLSDGFNIEIKSGLNEAEQVILAGLSEQEIAEKASVQFRRR